MVSTKGNIRMWIEQSDIDYITQYIKAWIGFNAWYNNEYNKLKGDREKINKIKNSPNTIQNKFNSLMEKDGQKDKEFKSYLASLHNELQQNQIGSEEKPILFDGLKDTNPKDQLEKVHHGVGYSLKREDNSKFGYIKNIEIHLKGKSGEKIFNYKHTEYSLSHIEDNKAYQKLPKPQQEQIRVYFEALEPTIVKPIIQNNTEEQPKNYYSCGGIFFVRDPDATPSSKIMFECLIETLYKLRHALFHGELTPNANSQKIYKNAYFCLKYLLESIKQI